MKILIPKEIDEQLEFEDVAGVNTTLQELVCAQQRNKEVIVVKEDNGIIEVLEVLK